MGQQYPQSTSWEGGIMVILHFFGTRVIFLLFCDHQDIESIQSEI